MGRFELSASVTGRESFGYLGRLSAYEGGLRRGVC